MSQTLATPTLTASARRALLRAWDDPESRSTLVGIAGVIIFYLLLWVAAPYILRVQTVAAVSRPHAASRTLSIQLEPDMFVNKPAPKQDPFKFVETNPDAPENTPDKTTNFAARNQQVAQEKPTPDGKSDRPALEGKKDLDSTQIVSGRLSQPIEQIEAVAPPPDTRVAEQTVAAPKQEQNPLTGFDKKQGEDATSFGTNISTSPDNAKPIPEKIDGAKDVPVVEGAMATQVAIDPQHPRARPMVVKQQNTRPAIFAENKFGSANIGPIAIDAKWSNYGAYLQRLIDSVQTQWERLLIESRIYPPSGTTVEVKFILDSEGKISQIVNVDNQSSEQAGHACVSAITDRAPYGLWTDDMKAMLGEKQEMTFKFFYQ
jgi:hypothetical protein